MQRLNQDTGRRACQGGGCRQLLASSAAYHMRVRRMLLGSMQGSVNSNMTPRSSGAVLSTTAVLVTAGSLEDLQPGDGHESAASLERASLLAAQRPDFTESDLQAAMRVCDAVLFASRMEDDPLRCDQVVQSVVLSVRLVTAAYANLMLLSSTETWERV
eukprot:202171-Rhodomonas_salina.1